MKIHTSNFKTQIAELGRELDSIITYTINNQQYTLTNEDLNEVSPSYKGGLLKSIMKELKIDSNTNIPIGTIVNYQFGVKVGDSYEYLDYGNYIVYSSEKKEDTRSYEILCYDKMLYSMKSYEKLDITYPITIRNYINEICNKIGLEFENINTTFANYDKEVNKELFLDENDKDLGFTFRDILDQLAEVTGSIICINSNDKLEVRYPHLTYDIIDENFLKDTNVNFEKKFGPINLLTLSRSANSDIIHYPEIIPEEPKEIKISDNQFMNFNDRNTYMEEIYNALQTAEFYICDYESTGICYYDIYDIYFVTIDGNSYKCIMLNDEINITQGLSENIYVEEPNVSETEYKYTNSIDKRINQTTLIVDKQEKRIEGLVSDFEDLTDSVKPLAESSTNPLELENSGGKTLVNYELEGNIHQDTTIGKNLIGGFEYSRTSGGVTFTYNKDGSITCSGTSTSNNVSSMLSGTAVANNYLFTLQAGTYTISGGLNNIKIQIVASDGTNIKTVSNYESFTLNTETIIFFRVNIPNTGTSVNTTIYPQLELGSSVTSYEPYTGGIPSPNPNYEQPIDVVDGYNLIDTTLINRTYNGCTWTGHTDGLLTIQGTLTSNITYGETVNKKLKKGYHRFLIKEPIEKTIKIKIVKDDGTNKYITITSGATSVSFYLETTAHSYQIYMDGLISGEEIDISCYPMLSESSDIKEYLPYNNIGLKNIGTNQEIITPIDLQGNFIGKIGDTKDLLRYENGHIYLDKKIGKKVFVGAIEETYTTSTAGGFRRFVINVNDAINSSGRSEIKSNYFRYSSNTNEDGICFLSSKNIYFYKNDISTTTEFKNWLSTHNTEVYYILAEPYTVDLGEYTLPTLEGNSTISLLATLQGNMYCRYIRKTDFNDTFQTIDGMRDYYNKVETDARITIETDNINESVSEIRSLVDENGNNIMSLQQSVTEQITSTQAQFSVINSTLENGVEKVNTGLITIDIDGLRVQKGDSKVLTLMANNTFALVKTPYDSANPEYLAFFGYDEIEQTSKAQMDNLTITNYLTAGYHRQEKMTNVENARGEYENRTGWFYAGGI